MISLRAFCLLILTPMVIGAITRDFPPEEKSLDPRPKREIDGDFLRRYNHLRSSYRDNPFAFHFLRYFLRNRGQKRERRQIDGNSYYPNNQYTSYNQPNPTRQTIGYNSPPSNLYRGYNQNAADRQYYDSNGYNPANDPYYVRYTPSQRARPTTTQRPKKKVTKRKPFRPPMVFF